MKWKKPKLLVFFIVIVFFLVLFNGSAKIVLIDEFSVELRSDVGDQVALWLKNRQNYVKNKTLSNLGKMLFLNEFKSLKPHGNFTILTWKYGRTIEARHLKNFGQKNVDPFRHCSVSNCHITYDSDKLSKADLVLFHLHQMAGRQDMPFIEQRPKHQVWAFLTDESPFHTFLKKAKLTDFNGVFNWSMSYRMDSDIPVPYGRTVLAENPHFDGVKLYKRRDVLLAILGSNCGGKNHRWDYVRELQKHIKVHVFGGCGPFKTCPGRFRADCQDIDNYLFYLSFENSNCDEYITEKLWWNAFQKNSIPIVMGASPMSYSNLLPPGSYLNVEDFASPAVLSQYLLHLNSTNSFESFFHWKKHFRVLNEHGYFQSESFHYCRVCEALNYNSRTPKTYENLESFWSVHKDCHPAWNAPPSA